MLVNDGSAWQRGCGWEQTVSSFQNVLWCWSVEVDALTPTTPSCVSAGLFVFLAFEEHQCLTQREIYIFSPSESTFL